MQILLHVVDVRLSHSVLFTKLGTPCMELFQLSVFDLDHFPPSSF